MKRIIIVVALVLSFSTIPASAQRVPMQCLGDYFAALYTYDAYVKIVEARRSTNDGEITVDEFNRVSRNYKRFRNVLLDCFERIEVRDCNTAYGKAQDARREAFRLHNEYSKLEKEEQREKTNRQNPSFQSAQLSRLGGKAINASSKFHDCFGELLYCLR